MLKAMFLGLALLPMTFATPAKADTANTMSPVALNATADFLEDIAQPHDPHCYRRCHRRYDRCTHNCRHHGGRHCRRHCDRDYHSCRHHCRHH